MMKGTKGPSDGLTLMRLMHLSSVGLPVGGYSFSHGLEFALDARWLNNADQIEQWITVQLLHGLARVDLPVLLNVMRVLDNSPNVQTDKARNLMNQAGPLHLLQPWNDLALACRESRELRMTDAAMGNALAKLLPALGLPCLPAQPGFDWSFPVLFAWASQAWAIEPHHAACGYAWSWLENQVTAATKLLPLGQTQAQALLASCQYSVPQAVALAATLGEDDIGASLPALAAASARHETQYTRLFRS
ncbi:urease accessory protein UreF [Limnobacter litoralis]|uniref:Urease accessory protein UreF n=1 Tax=Limnobacter litoralis TaxID=481366 RepID=A0ABQ5YMH6_9BURK|nr:urease accessory UreF family protein [Limnobacter litoralis]GLR25000.1 urease accessory protein UreF [Limnobacter litoralis]